MKIVIETIFFANHHQRRDAMNSVEKAQQTQLANIEAKTGKSLKQLAKVVESSGLTKHGEIIAMLKEKFAIGHGDANAIAHHAKSLTAPPTASSSSPDSATDEIYAGPKAILRPIHDAVVAKLNAFGEFEISPKKGYLSLRRKKQFMTIGPATKTRVDLGINLKGVAGTDRFVEQPAAAMCQFKVGLTALEHVDAELITWLKKAFDAAG